MGDNADHRTLGSKVLISGEIAAKSEKFAEGYARLRDVTDRDGALPAWAKALYMASAAAVKGLHYATQWRCTGKPHGHMCIL